MICSFNWLNYFLLWRLSGYGDASFSCRDTRIYIHKIHLSREERLDFGLTAARSYITTIWFWWNATVQRREAEIAYDTFDLEFLDLSYFVHNFLLYLYNRVFRHDRRPVSRPPQSRALNCEPKTDLSELAAADLRAVKDTSSWQLGVGRCPPTYIRSLSTISHGHTPALRPQCPLILFWSL